MKTKFYYNGKLVRTSDHNYTHAVINIETGAVVGCRTSAQAAQSIITTEVNAYIRGFENAEKAIKALEAGKSTVILKSGRRSYPCRLDNDTVESWQKWMEDSKARMERIQKSWKVVELEAR